MVDLAANDLIGNLLAEGIVAAGRQLVRLDRNAADRRAVLRGEVIVAPEVTRAIDAASERLSELVTDEAEKEAVAAFLTSPEARQVATEIFTSALGNYASVDQIKEDFKLMLGIATGLQGEELDARADSLFDALVDASGVALSAAIAAGVLPAHDAAEAARFRLLKDQLDNIERNQVLIQGSDAKPDYEAITAFETEYRRQVHAREAHIVPPSLDRNQKLPIGELYVAPGFILPGGTGPDGAPLATYADVVADLHRAVLLGDPGGGKSTFALKLVHDLSAPNGGVNGRQLTPILVILREFGAAKERTSCSILDYIEQMARTRYQLPDVPAGAFEYLLRSNRAIVIFDGLDELLDTSYRQEISADVESFGSYYSMAPILVTSRRVGYEQAPLDDSAFPIIQLAEFDTDQVEDYAMKWFRLEATLSNEEANERVASFVQESDAIPDLRANPLLLGLLCNIYRGENYIPSNRPDVFKKCAVLLFERWDRRRGIEVHVPFESLLRPAMQYLACWIYSDAALQGGVTEDDLVQKATEYLHGRRFEDEGEAREAAKEFIGLCRGRAWVFTDIGSTGTGTSLFQFTHRTFLEYFTAEYLTRTHNSPDQLVELLAPKIRLREWDVVCQLAVQVQSEQVEDAADAILNALLDQAQQEEDGRERGNLVSFCARTLEFFVPSPQCTRRVIRQAFEEAVAQVAASYMVRKGEGKSRVVGGESPAEELVVAIVGAGAETREIARDELTKQATEGLREGHGDPSSILEIVLHLNLAVRKLGRHEPDSSFWEQVAQSVVETCADEVTEVARHDFNVGIESVRFKLLSLDEFIGLYGLEGMFRERTYRAFGNVTGMPLAVYAVWGTLRPWPESPPWISPELVLDKLAQLLPSLPTPWVSGVVTEGISFQSWIFHSPPVENGDRLIAESDWSPARKFAVFGAMAICFEPQSEEEQRAVVHTSQADAAPLALARRLLQARFEKSAADEVDRIASREFEPNAADMVRQWCAGKIDLVAESPTPPTDDEVEQETAE